MLIVVVPRAAPPSRIHVRGHAVIVAVAVLGGSAKAEDPSTATAWTCTSQTSGRAEYVIEGNELKKRDDDLQRYEACRRNHPAPTPGPDGKVNADSFLTDPCEPLDLQNYTFQIVLNNQIGLVAVSPETGIRDDASIWVSGRTIVIDKLTGNYVETLLSTPTLPLSPEAKKRKQSDAGLSVAGYGGTCDAMPLGDPKSVAGVLDGSHNPDPVVKEEKKPTKKSDTREAHVHGNRHNYRHKH